MIQRRAKKKTKIAKKTPPLAAPTRPDRKLLMTTVWVTHQHLTLLDEICFYVAKNSMGLYRPNRSELMRLLIESLAKEKRKLKQVRSPEDMKKALLK